MVLDVGRLFMKCNYPYLRVVCMDYLGPNRRGRAGRSFRGKQRKAAQPQHQSVKSDVVLWDNSERFSEEPSEEDDEGSFLDLESSLVSRLKSSGSKEEFVDELSLEFIESVEHCLNDLSPQEICRRVLYPTSTDSSSDLEQLNFLDLEFEPCPNSSVTEEKEDAVVDSEAGSSQRDINLLSSASNEAFDAWFDNLTLK